MMPDSSGKMTPHQRLLHQAGQLIPPLLSKFHKGQMGRIAVVGGSKDYTGAPYFSAMASAKLGADMSHVICSQGAGPVIKTYSPNLMVHPLLEETASHSTSPLSTNQIADAARRIVNEISSSLLSRLHVLVIGPGLGRDPLMQETAKQLIYAAAFREIPVVLDADALAVIQNDPLNFNYKDCVLTPNVVEFGRLMAAAIGEDKKGEGSLQEQCQLLADALNGPTVLQKGNVDYIATGGVEEVASCEVQGGLKRSGGQGDTLTGAIGTFLCWRHAYHQELWKEGSGTPRLSREESFRAAVWAGAAVARTASRLAFNEKGRSLQASDLTEKVHKAFMELWGTEKEAYEVPE